MKRVPFPEPLMKRKREIGSRYSELSEDERENIRLRALKHNRYLLHEAAVRLGVCK